METYASIFGGCIVTAAIGAQHASDRAHGDNVTAIIPHHVGQEGLHCPVMRDDVDVVRVLDNPVVQLPEGLAANDARIVDQYVHGPHIRRHLAGPLVDLLPI